PFFLSRIVSLLFLPRTRPPPISTLFPYTTLFRSEAQSADRDHSFDRHHVLSARELHDGEFEPGPYERDEGEPADRSDGRNAGQKDRKSTRLNSSHRTISYAVFCLKKKKKKKKKQD